MNSILKELNDKISSNPYFLDTEGKLLREKVKSAVLNLDDELLKILLEDECLRKAFFKEENNYLIFDKAKFSWVISSKDFLPDSFTSFKNKIGLIDENNNFITQNGKVVLSFPYKDTLLIGGQKKEDESRKENFFNLTLCRDEIDTILEPKALRKKYKYVDGEVVNNFACTPKDNYIIKGNNLLALYSLLPIYEGKVNLIFIDPPYNTNNSDDTFKYNDSFDHSTWLTFMKNRLEVAKRLLAPNGSIYVSMDYNEVHYLKVLMDEIFGRNCFQREIIWRIGWLSGYKTSAKNFIRNHDTILFYTKDPNDFVFNKIYLDREKDYQERFNDATLNKILDHIQQNFGKLTKEQKKEFSDLLKYEGLPERYPMEDTWNCSIYDKLNSIAVVSYSGEKVSKMLDVDEIKGQKAEKLIKRIMDVSTKEGDLVLDFFLGSGTTAAVAQKMGRHYIGIEQLDYIESTVCERLKKVIKGEDKSGVTGDCNYGGKGSFIYCELLDENKNLVDQILSENAKLDEIYDNLMNNPFLVNYKVNLNDASSIDIRNQFNTLSDDDKKRALISLIDKNTIYTNYSEIEDQDKNVSQSDIEFSRSFYNGGVKDE